MHGQRCVFLAIEISLLESDLNDMRFNCILVLRERERERKREREREK